MESRFCPKINESVLLRYFTKQLTDREAECVEEWIQASEKIDKLLVMCIIFYSLQRHGLI